MRIHLPLSSAMMTFVAMLTLIDQVSPYLDNSTFPGSGTILFTLVDEAQVDGVNDTLLEGHGSKD